MNIKEQIRAEIERRHTYEKKQYEKKKPDGRPNDGWAESLAIMGVLEDLLSFLDSLPEQPVEMDNEEKIRNFFDAIGDCGFSQYDILRLKSIWEDMSYSIPKQEQPVEGLEEEIKRFLSNATKMNKGEWRGKYSISDIGFRAVARHFAEWGAEHLKR